MLSQAFSSILSKCECAEAKSMSKTPPIDVNLLKEFISHLDEDALDEVYRVVNARRSALKADRKIRKRKKRVNHRYEGGKTGRDKSLEELLNADWGEVFSQADDKERKFCVYAHGDPRNKTWKKPEFLGVTFMKPIYVGMGDELRPYNFAGRSVMHLNKLNALMAEGYDRQDLVSVLASGLTEKEAREMESKLILFWGISSLSRRGTERHREFGSAKRVLLNSRYEPMPEEYEDLM